MTYHMHMNYCFNMRTTLDLPAELMDSARSRLGFRSKTDTIIFALRQVVRHDRLDELKALLGKVEFTADAKTLRGKKPARSK